MPDQEPTAGRAPDARPSDEHSALASPTAAASPAPAAQSANGEAGQMDLRWVWLEVRKRVFIKLPFSRPVAEAMEAVIPIALEKDRFVCGLSTQNFPMSGSLNAEQVRNTIESILRQAAGRPIHFEVIEGTTLEDWQEIKQRRDRAQEAIIAMAEHNVESHNFDDVINQIIGEIRHRVTSTRDRNFPHVRARLILDIVPLLSDTFDMLFPDRESHDAGRVMARTIDRVANFIDLAPLPLALEVERYHRAQNPRPKPSEQPPQQP